MALQQFGGINAVCFYASSIFEVAGKEDRITQSLNWHAAQRFMIDVLIF